MMGSYQYESPSAERKTITRKPMHRIPTFDPGLDLYAKMSSITSNFNTTKSGFLGDDTGPECSMQYKFKRFSCSAPTPKQARKIAYGIKRHIILTRELNRTPNFVKRVHKKIVYLHNYNCRVAETSSMYPMDHDIRELLLKYIELEMWVLKKSEHNTIKYRYIVERRMLKLLSIIFSKYCYYLKGKFNLNDTWQHILDLFEGVSLDVPDLFSDISQKVKDRKRGNAPLEPPEDEAAVDRLHMPTRRDVKVTELDPESDPLFKCCADFNVFPEVQEAVSPVPFEQMVPEGLPIETSEVITSEDKLTDTGQLLDEDKFKKEDQYMLYAPLVQRLKSLQSSADPSDNKNLAIEVIDLCDDTLDRKMYPVSKTRLRRSTVIDLIDSSDDEGQPTNTSVIECTARVGRQCDKIVDSVVSLGEDSCKNKNVISRISTTGFEEESGDVSNGVGDGGRIDETEILSQIRELLSLTGASQVSTKMVNNKIVITPRSNLDMTDVNKTIKRRDSVKDSTIPIPSSTETAASKPLGDDNDLSTQPFPSNQEDNKNIETAVKESSQDSSTSAEMPASPQVKTSSLAEEQLNKTIIVYKSINPSYPILPSSDDDFKSQYEIELEQERSNTIGENKLSNEPSLQKEKSSSKNDEVMACQETSINIDRDLKHNLNLSRDIPHSIEENLKILPKGTDLSNDNAPLSKDVIVDDTRISKELPKADVEEVKSQSNEVTLNSDTNRTGDTFEDTISQIIKEVIDKICLEKDLQKDGNKIISNTTINEMVNIKPSLKVESGGKKKPGKAEKIIGTDTKPTVKSPDMSEDLNNSDIGTTNITLQVMKPQVDVGPNSREADLNTSKLLYPIEENVKTLPKRTVILNENKDISKEATFLTETHQIECDEESVKGSNSSKRVKTLQLHESYTGSSKQKSQKTRQVDPNTNEIACPKEENVKTLPKRTDMTEENKTISTKAILVKENICRESEIIVNTNKNKQITKPTEENIENSNSQEVETVQLLKSHTQSNKEGSEKPKELELSTNKKEKAQARSEVKKVCPESAIFLANTVNKQRIKPTEENVESSNSNKVETLQLPESHTEGNKEKSKKYKKVELDINKITCSNEENSKTLPEITGLPEENKTISEVVLFLNEKPQTKSKVVEKICEESEIILAKTRNKQLIKPTEENVESSNSNKVETLQLPESHTEGNKEKSKKYKTEELDINKITCSNEENSKTLPEITGLSEENKTISEVVLFLNEKPETKSKVVEKICEESEIILAKTRNKQLIKPTEENVESSNSKKVETLQLPESHTKSNKEKSKKHKKVELDINKITCSNEENSKTLPEITGLPEENKTISDEALSLNEKPETKSKVVEKICEESEIILAKTRNKQLIKPTEENVKSSNSKKVETLQLPESHTKSNKEKSQKHKKVELDINKITCSNKENSKTLPEITGLPEENKTISDEALSLNEKPETKSKVVEKICEESEIILAKTRNKQLIKATEENVESSNSKKVETLQLPESHTKSNKEESKKHKKVELDINKITCSNKENSKTLPEITGLPEENKTISDEALSLNEKPETKSKVVEKICEESEIILAKTRNKQLIKATEENVESSNSKKVETLQLPESHTKSNKEESKKHKKVELDINKITCPNEENSKTLPEITGLSEENKTISEVVLFLNEKPQTKSKVVEKICEESEIILAKTRNKQLIKATEENVESSNSKKVETLQLPESHTESNKEKSKKYKKVELDINKITCPSKKNPNTLPEITSLSEENKAICEEALFLNENAQTKSKVVVERICEESEIILAKATNKQIIKPTEENVKSSTSKKVETSQLPESHNESNREGSEQTGVELNTNKMSLKQKAQIKCEVKKICQETGIFHVNKQIIKPTEENVESTNSKKVETLQLPESHAESNKEKSENKENPKTLPEITGMSEDSEEAQTKSKVVETICQEPETILGKTTNKQRTNLTKEKVESSNRIKVETSQLPKSNTESNKEKSEQYKKVEQNISKITGPNKKNVKKLTEKTCKSEENKSISDEAMTTTKQKNKSTKANIESSTSKKMAKLQLLESHKESNSEESKKVMEVEINTHNIVCPNEENVRTSPEKTGTAEENKADMEKVCKESETIIDMSTTRQQTKLTKDNIESSKNIEPLQFFESHIESNKIELEKQGKVKTNKYEFAFFLEENIKTLPKETSISKENEAISKEDEKPQTDSDVKKAFQESEINIDIIKNKENTEQTKKHIESTKNSKKGKKNQLVESHTDSIEEKSKNTVHDVEIKQVNKYLSKSVEVPTTSEAQSNDVNKNIQLDNIKVVVENIEENTVKGRESTFVSERSSLSSSIKNNKPKDFRILLSRTLVDNIFKNAKLSTKSETKSNTETPSQTQMGVIEELQDLPISTNNLSSTELIFDAVTPPNKQIHLSDGSTNVGSKNSNVDESVLLARYEEKENSKHLIKENKNIENKEVGALPDKITDNIKEAEKNQNMDLKLKQMDGNVKIPLHNEIVSTNNGESDNSLVLQPQNNLTAVISDTESKNMTIDSLSDFFKISPIKECMKQHYTENQTSPPDYKGSVDVKSDESSSFSTEIKSSSSDDIFEEHAKPIHEDTVLFYMDDCETVEISTCEDNFDIDENFMDDSADLQDESLGSFKEQATKLDGPIHTEIAEKTGTTIQIESTTTEDLSHDNVMIEKDNPFENVSLESAFSENQLKHPTKRHSKTTGHQINEDSKTDIRGLEENNANILFVKVIDSSKESVNKNHSINDNLCDESDILEEHIEYPSSNLHHNDITVDQESIKETVIAFVKNQENVKDIGGNSQEYTLKDTLDNVASKVIEDADLKIKKLGNTDSFQVSYYADSEPTSLIPFNEQQIVAEILNDLVQSVSDEIEKNNEQNLQKKYSLYSQPISTVVQGNSEIQAVSNSTEIINNDLSLPGSCLDFICYSMSENLTARQERILKLDETTPRPDPRKELQNIKSIPHNQYTCLLDLTNAKTVPNDAKASGNTVIPIETNNKLNLTTNNNVGEQKSETSHYHQSVGLCAEQNKESAGNVQPSDIPFTFGNGKKMGTSNVLFYGGQSPTHGLNTLAVVALEQGKINLETGSDSEGCLVIDDSYAPDNPYLLNDSSKKGKTCTRHKPIILRQTNKSCVANTQQFPLRKTERTKTKAERKQMFESKDDTHSSERDSEDDRPLAERVKSRSPSPKKSKSRYGTTDILVGREAKQNVQSKPITQEVKNTPYKLRSRSTSGSEDINTHRAPVLHNNDVNVPIFALGQNTALEAAKNVIPVIKHEPLQKRLISTRQQPANAVFDFLSSAESAKPSQMHNVAPGVTMYAVRPNITMEETRKKEKKIPMPPELTVTPIAPADTSAFNLNETDQPVFRQQLKPAQEQFNDPAFGLLLNRGFTITSATVNANDEEVFPESLEGISNEISQQPKKSRKRSNKTIVEAKSTNEVKQFVPVSKDRHHPRKSLTPVRNRSSIVQDDVFRVSVVNKDDDVLSYAKRLRSSTDNNHITLSLDNEVLKDCKLLQSKEPATQLVGKRRGRNPKKANEQKRDTSTNDQETKMGEITTQKALFESNISSVSQRLVDVETPKCETVAIPNPQENNPDLTLDLSPTPKESSTTPNLTLILPPPELKEYLPNHQVTTPKERFKRFFRAQTQSASNVQEKKDCLKQPYFSNCKNFVKSTADKLKKKLQTEGSVVSLDSSFEENMPEDETKEIGKLKTNSEDLSKDSIKNQVSETSPVETENIDKTKNSKAESSLENLLSDDMPLSKLKEISQSKKGDELYVKLPLNIESIVITSTKNKDIQQKKETDVRQLLENLQQQTSKVEIIEKQIDKEAKNEIVSNRDCSEANSKKTPEESPLHSIQKTDIQSATSAKTRKNTRLVQKEQNQPSIQNVQEDITKYNSNILAGAVETKTLGEDSFSSTDSEFFSIQNTVKHALNNFDEEGINSDKPIDTAENDSYIPIKKAIKGTLKVTGNKKITNLPNDKGQSNISSTNVSLDDSDSEIENKTKDLDRSRRIIREKKKDKKRVKTRKDFKEKVSDRRNEKHENVEDKNSTERKKGKIYKPEKESMKSTETERHKRKNERRKEPSSKQEKHKESKREKSYTRRHTKSSEEQNADTKSLEDFFKIIDSNENKEEKIIFDQESPDNSNCDSESDTNKKRLGRPKTGQGKKDKVEQGETNGKASGDKHNSKSNNKYGTGHTVTRSNYCSSDRRSRSSAKIESKRDTKKSTRTSTEKTLGCNDELSVSIFKDNILTNPITLSSIRTSNSSKPSTDEIKNCQEHKTTKNDTNKDIDLKYKKGTSTRHTSKKHGTTKSSTSKNSDIVNITKTFTEDISERKLQIQLVKIPTAEDSGSYKTVAELKSKKQDSVTKNVNGRKRKIIEIKDRLYLEKKPKSENNSVTDMDKIGPKEKPDPQESLNFNAFRGKINIRENVQENKDSSGLEPSQKPDITSLSSNKSTEVTFLTKDVSGDDLLSPVTELSVKDTKKHKIKEKENNKKECLTNTSKTKSEKKIILKNDKDTVLEDFEQTENSKKREINLENKDTYKSCSSKIDDNQTLHKSTSKKETNDYSLSQQATPKQGLKPTNKDKDLKDNKLNEKAKEESSSISLKGKEKDKVNILKNIELTKKLKKMENILEEQNKNDSSVSVIHNQPVQDLTNKKEEKEYSLSQQATPKQGLKATNEDKDLKHSILLGQKDKQTLKPKHEDKHSKSKLNEKKEEQKIDFKFKQTDEAKVLEDVELIRKAEKVDPVLPKETDIKESKTSNITKELTKKLKKMENILEEQNKNESSVSVIHNQPVQDSTNTKKKKDYSLSQQATPKQGLKSTNEYKDLKPSKLNEKAKEENSRMDLKVKEKDRIDILKNTELTKKLKNMENTLEEQNKNESSVSVILNQSAEHLLGKIYDKTEDSKDHKLNDKAKKEEQSIDLKNKEKYEANILEDIKLTNTLEKQNKNESSVSVTNNQTVQKLLGQKDKETKNVSISPQDTPKQTLKPNHEDKESKNKLNNIKVEKNIDFKGKETNEKKVLEDVELIKKSEKVDPVLPIETEIEESKTSTILKEQSCLSSSAIIVKGTIIDEHLETGKDLIKDIPEPKTVHEQCVSFVEPRIKANVPEDSSLATKKPEKTIILNSTTSLQYLSTKPVDIPKPELCLSQNYREAKKQCDLTISNTNLQLPQVQEPLKTTETSTCNTSAPVDSASNLTFKCESAVHCVKLGNEKVEIRFNNIAENARYTTDSSCKDTILEDVEQTENSKKIEISLENKDKYKSCSSKIDDNQTVHKSASKREKIDYSLSQQATPKQGLKPTNKDKDFEKAKKENSRIDLEGKEKNKINILTNIELTKTLMNTDNKLEEQKKNESNVYVISNQSAEDILGRKYDKTDDSKVNKLNDNAKQTENCIDLKNKEKKEANILNDITLTNTLEQQNKNGSSVSVTNNRTVQKLLGQKDKQTKNVLISPQVTPKQANLKPKHEDKHSKSKSNEKKEEKKIDFEVKETDKAKVLEDVELIRKPEKVDPVLPKETEMKESKTSNITNEHSRLSSSALIVKGTIIDESLGTDKELVKDTPEQKNIHEQCAYFVEPMIKANVPEDSSLATKKTEKTLILNSTTSLQYLSTKPVDISKSKLDLGKNYCDSKKQCDLSISNTNLQLPQVQEPLKTPTCNTSAPIDNTSNLTPKCESALPCVKLDNEEVEIKLNNIAAKNTTDSSCKNEFNNFPVPSTAENKSKLNFGIDSLIINKASSLKVESPVEPEKLVVANEQNINDELFKEMEEFNQTISTTKNTQTALASKELPSNAAKMPNDATDLQDISKIEQASVAVANIDTHPQEQETLEVLPMVLQNDTAPAPVCPKETQVIETKSEKKTITRKRKAHDSNDPRVSNVSRKSYKYNEDLVISTLSQVKSRLINTKNFEDASFYELSVVTEISDNPDNSAVNKSPQGCFKDVSLNSEPLKSPNSNQQKQGFKTPQQKISDVFAEFLNMSDKCTNNTEQHNLEKNELNNLVEQDRTNLKLLAERDSSEHSNHSNSITIDLQYASKKEELYNSMQNYYRNPSPPVATSTDSMTKFRNLSPPNTNCLSPFENQISENIIYDFVENNTINTTCVGVVTDSLQYSQAHSDLLQGPGVKPPQYFDNLQNNTVDSTVGPQYCQEDLAYQNDLSNFEDSLTRSFYNQKTDGKPTENMIISSVPTSLSGSRSMQALRPSPQLETNTNCLASFDNQTSGNINNYHHSPASPGIANFVKNDSINTNTSCVGVGTDSLQYSQTHAGLLQGSDVDRLQYLDNNLESNVVSAVDHQYNLSNFEDSLQSSFYTQQTICTPRGNMGDSFVPTNLAGSNNMQSIQKNEFSQESGGSDVLHDGVEFLPEYDDTSESVLVNYNPPETFGASPAASSMSQQSENTKDTPEEKIPLIAFPTNDHTYPKDVFIGDANNATEEELQPYKNYKPESCNSAVGWQPIYGWDETAKVVVEAQPASYMDDYLQSATERNDNVLDKKKNNAIMDWLCYLTETEISTTNQPPNEEPVIQEPAKEDESKQKKQSPKLPKAKAGNKSNPMIIPLRRRNWTKVVASSRTASPKIRKEDINCGKIELSPLKPQEVEIQCQNSISDVLVPLDRVTRSASKHVTPPTQPQYSSSTASVASSMPTLVGKDASMVDLSQIKVNIPCERPNTRLAQQEKSATSPQAHAVLPNLAEQPPELPQNSSRVARQSTRLTQQEKSSTSPQAHAVLANLTEQPPELSQSSSRVARQSTRLAQQEKSSTSPQAHAVLANLAEQSSELPQISSRVARQSTRIAQQEKSSTSPQAHAVLANLTEPPSELPQSSSRDSRQSTRFAQQEKSSTSPQAHAVLPNLAEQSSELPQSSSRVARQSTKLAKQEKSSPLPQAHGVSLNTADQSQLAQSSSRTTPICTVRGIVSKQIVKGKTVRFIYVKKPSDKTHQENTVDAPPLVALTPENGIKATKSADVNSPNKTNLDIKKTTIPKGSSAKSKPASKKSPNQFPPIDPLVAETRASTKQIQEAIIKSLKRSIEEKASACEPKKTCSDPFDSLKKSPMNPLFDSRKLTANLDASPSEILFPEGPRRMGDKSPKESNSNDAAEVSEHAWRDKMGVDTAWLMLPTQLSNPSNSSK